MNNLSVKLCYWLSPVSTNCISHRPSFRPYSLNGLWALHIRFILVPHLNKQDGGHLELRVRIFYICVVIRNVTLSSERLHGQRALMAWFIPLKYFGEPIYQNRAILIFFSHLRTFSIIITIEKMPPGQLLCSTLNHELYSEPSFPVLTSVKSYFNVWFAENVHDTL